MTFYSPNAELQIPHIWHMGYKGKKSTEAPLNTPSVLVFQVSHNFTCHWQLTVTTVLTMKAVGVGAIHHTGLADLHHLLKMKQLSFHSSEHDLHSFSPKLLSQLRNQPHYLLKCLSLKQH